jgi:hypothetical protein
VPLANIRAAIDATANGGTVCLTLVSPTPPASVTMQPCWHRSTAGRDHRANSLFSGTQEIALARGGAISFRNMTLVALAEYGTCTDGREFRADRLEWDPGDLIST